MLSPRVYVIHENPEWLPPLAAAFDARGVPLEEILLTEESPFGGLDLSAAPPPGVYWSRMSASAHTRGNPHAKEYTRAVLAWLQAGGARVVNGNPGAASVSGLPVIDLEVSKIAQHLLLSNAGFDVPRTVAVFGRSRLPAAARDFGLPFISKHNQGGKGLGVRRFDSYDEFDAYVSSPSFEQPIDGITLLQEYLVAASPFITRAEFVGGRFVYAVKVDTSAGSFELCPADACAVPGEAPLFSLREGFETDPLVERYEQFLAANGIEIAGIEFMETLDGRRVTYDINTNTNYNPDVEVVSPVSGPGRIAEFLGGLL
jgi:glutathione synthase/RimK-type ligase-like ATP-grasp enzyme